MEYSAVSEQGIADMVEIDELNHATLLYNLYKRYVKDEIYTYVGPILLGMNPFKNLDYLYTEEQVTQYKKIINSKQPYEERKNMPPHIFAITAMAFKQMIESKQKQAIVISGESGAGKTESAKCAMKFLTKLSSKVRKSDSEKDSTGIEQKILDTNPVLESFGNSKTVRNNNSSRFGKYVILYFSHPKGEILGARVKNYLLEKSRVVGPAAGERNYHVFYHILRGASLDLLNELGLVNQLTGDRLEYQDFNFLKSGADVDQKIINDPLLFVELSQQFQNLGFTELEQMAIWKITAASLHLGEIQFDDSTYDENGKPCTVTNPERMQLIAKILGIQNTQDLITEIVNKPGAPGMTLRAPLKKNECVDARDSLAKCLYDNLFNWLVERMNLTILPEHESEDQFKLETKTIGLLDIFGFENFKENNFEQLCINYVNEKLHKLYISAIFDAEKFELRNEGLGDRVNQLKYPDLTSLDVIKILDEKLQTGSKLGGKNGESKIGIFNIINDCSTSKPRPTWEILMKRIDDMHKGANVYAKEKNKEKFKIRHSAKEVIYSTKQFIERNVDEISTSLEACINTKAEVTVQNIFQGITRPGQKVQQDEEKKGQKSQKKTIWHKFSDQMQDLMMELAEPLLDFKQQDPSTSEDNMMQQSISQGIKKGLSSQDSNKKLQTVDIEPCSLHFIRCIKPNDFKQQDCFIHAMCLQQITYMGVLESIDVKQKNYPYRKSFEEFYQRYELLSPIFGTMRYENMSKSGTDFKQLSQNILNEAFQGYKEFYAIGKTKILMRNECVALLEKAKSKQREVRDESARMIKRAFQLFLGYTNTQQNKGKIIQVQSYLRKKRQEIIDKRAKLFYEKALISVLKYKTDKRKDYELKASLILTDTYKKYMFREQLVKSLRDRQKVMKSIQNYMTIKRLRKYYICFTLSRQLMDRAFLLGKQRAEERSVRLVQRIFRGFTVRERQMNLVVNALKAKENLKLHVAAKRVQKRLRGMIVRNRMRHLHLTAQKIQGFIRMKWYREFYENLKGNVITVQRSVRRFLARRDIIKQRLIGYIGQEINVLKNVKQIENYQLFGQQADGAILQEISKSHTPHSLKKIQLFHKTIDIHIMTDLSEIYSQPWSGQWMKLSKECLQSEVPIMSVQVGATHSLAVNQKGKLFCWGWNDNGQCAKNNMDQSEVIIKNSSKQAQVFMNENEMLSGMVDNRIKQIVATQDRCLVLMHDTQELVVWGSNEKGQLGLGTYEDEFIPRKVEFFSKQGIKISGIAAGGDLSLCACENGEGYAWPFQRSGTTFSLPVKMPFSEKIKISRVSCGYNFGFFISSQGLVYSLGKDNSEGQLGLGHIYPRDVPELISSLKDIGERIDSLECGYKHAIAKSTLGKIYTWGWGAKGQLGHSHFDSEITPRLLVIEKNKHKEKAIQIAAGFSHSLIMLDNNRELLWFGTSGTLNQVNKPVQLRLSDILPELFPESSLLSFATGQQIDFAVVKIMSTWSKSLSLSNLLIADLRQINSVHPWNKIQSTLQQLATKWDPREVMPPYMDTISGMFNASIMKMPSQKTQQKYKDKNVANKTNKFQSSRTGPQGFGENISMVDLKKKNK